MCASSAPSKIVSWAVLAEDVLMQPQQVELTGMVPGEEEGCSMNTSSGSARWSTMHDSDDDQEGHAKKIIRLVCFLDVSADTNDRVYLNVDTCSEMNVTTSHETTAMIDDDKPDLKNVKAEVESI